MCAAFRRLAVRHYIMPGLVCPPPLKRKNKTKIKQTNQPVPVVLPAHSSWSSRELLWAPSGARPAGLLGTRCLEDPTRAEAGRGLRGSFYPAHLLQLGGLKPVAMCHVQMAFEHPGLWGLHSLSGQSQLCVTLTLKWFCMSLQASKTKAFQLHGGLQRSTPMHWLPTKCLEHNGTSSLCACLHNHT